MFDRESDYFRELYLTLDDPNITTFGSLENLNTFLKGFYSEVLGMPYQPFNERAVAATKGYSYIMQMLDHVIYVIVKSESNVEL